MFAKVKDKNVQRGNLGMLFGNRKRIMKYLNSILIGLPIWFVVGILITFSPEFGRALGLSGNIDAGKAVMLFFAGQVAGDLTSGFLSQYVKNRKSVIRLFILMSFVFVLVYLLAPFHSMAVFYGIIICLGVCNGYWTLFVTVAAELFGTNLRATVATSAPNFVRGALIPLAAFFQWGKALFGIIPSAIAVGILCYTASLIALKYLEETYGKDLDYTEN